jgi:hypothetical protein
MFEQRVSASQRRLALDIDAASIGLMLAAVFGLNAGWNVIGPTIVAVLSALVQTGITTRLVLLAAFSAAVFGLFALRTFKPLWYGRMGCVVALVVAWNEIARLAIQIQAADVVALVAAAYLFVRGLVSIQEARLLRS